LWFRFNYRELGNGIGFTEVRRTARTALGQQIADKMKSQWRDAAIALMNLIFARSLMPSGACAVVSRARKRTLIRCGRTRVSSHAFRSVLRLVTKSWHTHPLGFLFGLGFHTATEISLLGISAAGASQGFSILVDPRVSVLFTPDRTLNSTDSVLMHGAMAGRSLSLCASSI
jgi:high-affinity nickel permease